MSLRFFSRLFSRLFGCRWWMFTVVLTLACASTRSGTGSGRAELPSGPVALRVRLVDGSELSLASLRGRPVLLHLVATWSDPALLEIPRIEQLTSDFPELAIVSVVLEERAQLATLFQQSFKVSYPVGTVDDLASFTGANGPLGEIAVIPTSVLLDREGRIAARMDGMWSPGVLEQAVKKLFEQ